MLNILVQTALEQYYILDSEQHLTGGPFESEEDLLEEVGNLEITKLSDWENTVPTPKAAVFD